MVKYSWYGEEIISDHGEASLRKYTYKGGDESLIYKYVTSKLAQALVDYVYPTWLAPNLITFVGWILVTSPHIIALFFHGTDFSSPLPWWLCFYQGIMMYVYSIIDNSDGKQARKIKASSPLGLMFDHGLDMINTVIASLTLCRIMVMGNNYMTPGIVMLTLAQFYYATLEEYFIDGLFLPIFNGPNEGILGVIIICFIAGIFGSDIYATEIYSGIKINQIFFLITALSTVGALLMQ